ncbi:MAG: hypothetical protein Unbinned6805contig1000_9 [Prokaryotic dsDNA virus sp.]|nr:MAG: hypothetical protein Unbinned6805contig1000_9 [Prokaryotic dsDNA virus sp.]|tara:strand:- start:18651 stop:18917 length:267 start_codon:yes stop_codon:yes gene_type:complete
MAIGKAIDPFVWEERVRDSSPPSSMQVGGDHYKKMKIQPIEFALANSFNAGQTLALRYISRYKYKNGVEDLKKAIHSIELLIEHEENK